MKKTGVKTWEAETILKDIRISYQVRESEGGNISIAASTFKLDDFISSFNVMEDGVVGVTFISTVTDTEKKTLFNVYLKDCGEIVESRLKEEKE